MTDKYTKDIINILSWDYYVDVNQNIKTMFYFIPTISFLTKITNNSKNIYINISESKEYDSKNNLVVFSKTNISSYCKKSLDNNPIFYSAFLPNVSWTDKIYKDDNGLFYIIESEDNKKDNKKDEKDDKKDDKDDKKEEFKNSNKTDDDEYVKEDYKNMFNAFLKLEPKTIFIFCFIILSLLIFLKK